MYAGRRLEQFKEMMAGLPREIRRQSNGPYRVTNVENLTNWLGESLPRGRRWLYVGVGDRR